MVVEAKEYLQRIRLLDAKINSGLAHKAALMDMLTHITPTLRDDAGSGSGNHDKIGDGVVKLVALEQEINKDVDAFVDMKRDALRLLNQLTNPRYFTVLHDRYVLGHTWSNIADDLDISSEGVRKIHKRALIVFGRLMHNK